MQKISNLPKSKKVILKTRPNGNPVITDFDIIEEIASAPDDGEISVSYTHLTLPTILLV